MLKHNLTIIYRNLKKYKTTFFINLAGLSLGLACVLMIGLWVGDELSFDKYFQNNNRLYEVMTNIKSEKGIDTRRDSPHTLSEMLPSEMPQVQYATVATPDQFFPEFTLSGKGKKVTGTGKFAGKDFFRIFSYHLIQGNAAGVFSNKNGIVLSRTEAQNLFGSPDLAVGQTVSWAAVGIKRDCIVTGVFSNVPKNSSERFDFVLSFDDLKDIMGMGAGWSPEPFNTYLMVRKGTDIARFSTELNAYIKNKTHDKNRTYFLKRYADNYLYNKYENGKAAGGRIEYIRVFSLIALAILVISCINFMNLSTARAEKRIKEIGIKKAIGAGRKMLILQYLSESLLMSFLSLIVAAVIVYLMLPQFNLITQKNIHLHLDANIFFLLTGIAILTGLLAGSYPAIYLSGFKPAMILKGRFKSPFIELFTRKALVIFQFGLTLIFIVTVFVLYKQIAYIQNKNLGFDANCLVSFDADSKISDAYFDEIRRLPGVENASDMSGNLIGDKLSSQGIIHWNNRNIRVHSFGVNYGLIETLGLKIKDGRSFYKDFGSDNSPIIINEAAVETMGLKNPVGTIIRERGNNNEIIGVVKDFHFQSLHEKIEPVSFRLDDQAVSTIVVRIQKDRKKQAINSLSRLYHKFNPGAVFHYTFLNEQYQALYASDRQVSILSRYFAGLSILISCLGLFGLAAFTAESRRKEIGIRKVLGASALGIARLLSAGFIRIILLAISIALPVSFWITQSWLNSFAYRINLDWWYFAGAALVTIAVAFCTVSFQSLKAAMMNPVNSLKTE